MDTFNMEQIKNERFGQLLDVNMEAFIIGGIKVYVEKKDAERFRKIVNSTPGDFKRKKFYPRDKNINGN